MLHMTVISRGSAAPLEGMNSGLILPDLYIHAVCGICKHLSLRRGQIDIEKNI